MADGPGVDVLEGGPQAKEDPNELAAMRQAWREEAEKAAEYFSAIPGFANALPDAGVTQAVESAPEREVAGEVMTEVGGVAKEEKVPGRRVLSRLRHRLGRQPNEQPAPSVGSGHPEDGPVEGSPVEERPPAAAPSETSRSPRFHSSF